MASECLLEVIQARDEVFKLVYMLEKFRMKGTIKVDYSNCSRKIFVSRKDGAEIREKALKGSWECSSVGKMLAYHTQSPGSSP